MAWYNKAPKAAVVPVPDESWFKAVEATSAHSPDVAFLEKKEAHRVFVVDNLQANHRRAKVMSEAEGQKLCHAISQDKFAFWKMQDGSEVQPFPLRSNGGFVKPAPIRGELYLVPPSGLLILDRAMVNGVWYQRERVKLRIPYRRITGERTPEKSVYNRLVQEIPYMDDTVTAWMYVGREEAWNDLNQLASGTKINHTNSKGEKTITNINSDGRSYSAVKCFKPHNPRLENYYYFTQLEQPSSK